MVWVWLALLALLTAAGILERNYEKEVFEGRKKTFAPFAPLGLKIYDRVIKIKGTEDPEEERVRAVYRTADVKDCLRVRQAVRISMILCGLFLLLAFGVLFSLTGSKKTEEALELERPSFGETEEYSLTVEGISDEKQEVIVNVSGQEPEEEAMQAVFDEAWEKVKETALEDNPSEEEVRNDLNLPESTDYGIRIAWESLDPEYISDRGRILTEDIPEEGVICTLRAEMTYSAWSFIYDLNVCLYPPEKDAQYLMGKLLTEIEELEKADRKEEWFTLPEKIEDTGIRFYRSGGGKPWMLLPVFLLLGVFFAERDRQKLKEDFEKRQRCLYREYPSLVFKLSLMQNCGLTVRASWTRITGEYLRKKELGKTSENPLYEEMLSVLYELQTGKGEAEVYHRFGLRCGEECYLRLGNYLKQSINQGASGISRMLQAEMSEALEEQRNRMLKTGEEMNTKLLFPMIMMLGVVIAVLVAPALLSM